MHPKEDIRSLKQAGLVVLPLLLAIICFLAMICSGSYVLADSNSEISDFGAETIEGRDPLATLPLELVEEQGTTPSDLSSPSANDDSAETADDLDIPEEIALANPGESSILDTETTVLNVNDVELTALVKTFSKLTRRNYIVDSAVKGKVTIHLPTPVTVAEALRIFDTVLLLKGFTTVPVDNNTWKVIPAKDAKQTTIPFYDGEPDKSTDALITKMLRLRHLPSSEMEQLLTPFVSKEGVMKAISGSNSLLVIDSASNLERLARLAEKLDVPALDQEITIIPILYAEASDIAEKINEILGEDDEESQNVTQSITTRTGIVRRRRNANQQQKQKDAAADKRSLPLKIIPDERTNSLIVVADPELTLKVRALAEQLDSELDRSSGRFYVYHLKHSDAEELADILNTVISGAAESSNETTTRTRGSSLTRSSANRTQATTPQRNTQSRAALRRTSSQGNPADGRVTLEGEVSIASDPSTNSLIINASRSDYLRVKEVIDSLDRKRRQVLVEATLLEVMLSDEESMGVEWQTTAGNDNGGVIGQTNFGGLTDLFTNPAALTDFTLAAASSGTLTLPGGIVLPSQTLLITAASAHSNVNVLSSPTILATDNEEAEIIVGENVPFVSSTQTDSTNINTSFNNIERQDVGITLRITPQISTGEFVILDIFVEISNVVNGTRNDPNGPTTTIRTTETTVEVRNNQMIVTGGLIQDNQNDSTRGVPYFEDIPVLGQWFKTQSKTNRRTNLLVFLTPRVISDQFEAREQTVEFASELQDEIVLQDARPSRAEVLQNPDMDNVVESIDRADILPSTIHPPSTAFRQRSMKIEGPGLSAPIQTTEKGGAPLNSAARAALQRTEARLRNMKPQQGDSPQISPSKVEESDVLDITVSPSLPGDAPRPSVGPQSSKRTKSASLSPTRTAKHSAVSRSFIVLRSLNGTANNSSALRFADSQGTLGISVLGSPGSSSASFFQVGRGYSFNESRFVCLGVYGSIEEAKIVHETLAKPSLWQSLSPEETLSLGNGAWKSG